MTLWKSPRVFTVKSAYKLEYEIKNNDTAAASSSSRDVGDRNFWELIWKASIPDEIKIFVWRVATQSLATKQNAFRRTIFKENTCEICGNEMEDAFRFTGEDWLQMLLDPQSETGRNRTLLLLWQAWHLRNNMARGDEKDTVLESVVFLNRFDWGAKWSIAEHWYCKRKKLLVKLNSDAASFSESGDR